MKNKYMLVYPTQLVGKCSRCELELPLTVDHIIPQWLIKSIGNFGISHYDILANAGLIGIPVKERVCNECNSEKAGNIEWRDKIVRSYMRQFIIMLDGQFELTGQPRRLKVICECSECKPVQKDFQEKIMELKDQDARIYFNAGEQWSDTDDTPMPEWVKKKLERYDKRISK